MIIYRSILFPLVLIFFTILCVISILAFGELISRWKHSVDLDRRIQEIETEILRDNIVYARSKFKGFENMESDVDDFFKTFQAIPSTYRPYIEYRRLPNFRSNAVNINSLGYRGGGEFTVPKPEDTFRIVVYGGSTTWGTGALLDEQTIPAQLESYLREQYDGNLQVEVINAGESGYVSTQELIFLVIEGVYLHPDLVIFYDGVNDTARGYENFPAGYPGIYQRFRDIISEPKDADIENTYTIETELEYLKNQRKLVWKFESVLLIDLVKQSFSSIDVSRDFTRPEEIAIRQSTNMRIAKAIGDNFDFNIVSVIQPVPLFAKKLHKQEYEVMNYLRKRSQKHYLMLKYQEEHYEKYRNFLINLYDSYGINYLDLSEIFFDNDDPIYFDQCHMVPFGYEIVGQQIGRYVVEQGLIGLD